MSTLESTPLLYGVVDSASHLSPPTSSNSDVAEGGNSIVSNGEPQRRTLDEDEKKSGSDAYSLQDDIGKGNDGSLKDHR